MLERFFPLREHKALPLPSRESMRYLSLLKEFDVVAYRRKTKEERSGLETTLYGMVLFLAELYPPTVSLEEAIEHFHSRVGLLDEQGALFQQFLNEGKFVEVKGYVPLHHVMTLSYFLPHYIAFLYDQSFKRQLEPFLSQPPKWMEEPLYTATIFLETLPDVYAVPYIVSAILKTSEYLEGSIEKERFTFIDVETGKERAVEMAYDMVEEIDALAEGERSQAVKKLFLLYSYALGFYHESLEEVGSNGR